MDEKVVAGPLAEKDISNLGMQLAQGLAAAHKVGMVHRDLKPGNLRVTPDGRVKILDFGLAKLLRPADKDKEELVTAGPGELRGAMGTLPYMAPEQLQDEEVDQRCDIYAVGLVLYEIFRPSDREGTSVRPRLRGARGMLCDGLGLRVGQRAHLQGGDRCHEGVRDR